MKGRFVLLPGLWTGAWGWEPVTCGLRRRGHHVRPITLSGLAAPDTDVSAVGLQTHVDDVLSVLETEELGDVIVVGHSYSGIVAGQVADRAPDRVAHTVFVEAFLPHDGRSMLHAFPERQRAEELRLIADNHGRWPAPDSAIVADGQDLSPRQAQWLAERFVGHPGRTIAEPAVLTRPLAHQRATYVVCAMEHFGGRVSADVSAMRAAPNWTFHTLDTGHWPMISAPDPLVALLTGIAAQRR
ncbi:MULTISPECIES: alpha/beta fold hydrolase [Streptosporangium]|uniref:Pimeloyl-ACP methyl ester carboxylesterase n=1 Tax=Streptosporangium brasiliense TaxID=47480 RepID=A0ABT9RDE1_9ACTN|nr:alpha/beta hydrolase [Streptosporangium brasiliense]MDP9866420.1 pimeloyl-ACP methyl ester carboxylesterase [Streptosporangium brasiliense]